MGEDVPVNILQPHSRDLERVSFIKGPIRMKFAAMAMALEDGRGCVLTAPDDAGLIKKTMMVFMSDRGGELNHGRDNQPFQDSMATLFEGEVRVLCLVTWSCWWRSWAMTCHCTAWTCLRSSKADRIMVPGNYSGNWECLPNWNVDKGFSIFVQTLVGNSTWRHFIISSF
jgi:hypothetical protein